uniref:Cell wall protein n=2 Tax=Davidia involucrata TaxID=16924 RepID=A0A5B7ALA5_DAVIN
MAHNPHSVLAFLFIFNILLAIAGHAVAGRDIPINSENTDKKQPESFIGHDGTVLIPGFGRVIVPKFGKFGKGSSFNPFTYNPITGTSGGTGIGSTGGGGNIGSGGGTSRNYVPGGDDTFVPNPGVEVPIPGSGGNVPAAARP